MKSPVCLCNHFDDRPTQFSPNRQIIKEERAEHRLENDTVENGHDDLRGEVRVDIREIAAVYTLSADPGPPGRSGLTGYQTAH